MKNGLLRKIGTGIILPLAFAVSGCGKTYIIDGNQVKDKRIINGILIENRGDNLETKYILFGNGVSSKEPLKRIEINGTKYNKRDSLVYEAGNERYYYLWDKIDSINNAEKEEKRKAKIDYGLKALE